MPDSATNEKDIAVLQNQVHNLILSVKELDRELECHRMDKKRDLKWGLATLGAIILALIGYIWNTPHLSH